MAYDVIVSGHLCADLVPDASHTPLKALSSPGKLSEVGALTISTGGVVSNTGLALERLGVNVGLMTSVGDDLLGRVIIARLKERNEALGNLIQTRENTASSYSVILSPENMDRIILHCMGSNAQFDLDDIDFEQVKAAKIFHLGYPPLLPRLYEHEGEILAALYQQVQFAEVITSMDMTLPDPQSASGQVDWQRVLARSLPYVDIFLPSVEEIVMMLRRDDYDRWSGDVLSNITRGYLRQMADEITAMGVAITGFKLGEMGFYLRTTTDEKRLAFLERLGIDPATWHNLEMVQPTFAVQVVNTVGAGDAAYAAFLTGLLRQFSPQETLRMACAVGACNVELADATSGVQTWDATRERLKAGWHEAEKRLPE